MRLDFFLKLARLCPRRSIAQQLCDAGLVLLNGRPARPAHKVKAGDEILLRSRDRDLTARVTAVPETKNISRKEAARLVEVLHEAEPQE